MRAMDGSRGVLINWLQSVVVDLLIIGIGERQQSVSADIRCRPIIGQNRQLSAALSH